MSIIEGLVTAPLPAHFYPYRFGVCDKETDNLPNNNRAPSGLAVLSEKPTSIFTNWAIPLFSSMPTYIVPALIHAIHARALTGLHWTPRPALVLPVCLPPSHLSLTISKKEISIIIFRNHCYCFSATIEWGATPAASELNLAKSRPAYQCPFTIHLWWPRLNVHKNWWRINWNVCHCQRRTSALDLDLQIIWPICAVVWPDKQTKRLPNGIIKKKPLSDFNGRRQIQKIKWVHYSFSYLSGPSREAQFPRVARSSHCNAHSLNQ